MNDKELLKVFMFSCCEAGISEPQLNSVLPEVHKILANKMVHTYGNELYWNIAKWLEKMLVIQC